MLFKDYCRSPVGNLLLLSDGDSLTGLWFEGKYADEGDVLSKDLPVFKQVKLWLNRYFDGKNPKIDFPVSLRGTAFQKEVWALLEKIPYGTTVTYGDLAKLIAANRGIPRMSAQAVGNAVGKNPVSVIVPCHRVIGARGNLVGYGGGLERKKTLLMLENPGFLRDCQIVSTENA